MTETQSSPVCKGKMPYFSLNWQRRCFFDAPSGISVYNLANVSVSRSWNLKCEPFLRMPDWSVQKCCAPRCQPAKCGSCDVVAESSDGGQRGVLLLHVFSCVTDTLQLSCFYQLNKISQPVFFFCLSSRSECDSSRMVRYVHLKFSLKTHLNPFAFWWGKIILLGKAAFWFECVKRDILTSRCCPEWVVFLCLKDWGRPDMVPVIGVCRYYSVEEMMRFYVKCSPRSHSAVVSSFALWTLVAADL